MKKLFILSILLIATIIPQTTSSLEISVRDALSGDPLQGAVIKFENLPFAGVTGADGKFQLRTIPMGEWRIICSFVGYKTIKTNITIDGETNKVEIRMSHDQVVVPEIIVNGTRASEKGSSSTYSNLDKLEIERISVNRDIPSILNSLPSTSYYSESGTGIGYGYIRIRGFDQRRISVLINGVPQNDPEDHSVYWINFYDLANSLEDVQVQRGSSLSFYGPPAIGASINLVTNKPFVEPGVSFEAGTGSYNTKKYAINANSGVIADRFMIRVRGSKVQSDGYRDWSWSEFYRFFVTASYFDDIQTISLSAYGGPQEDGLAFYGISKSQNSDESARKYNYGATSRDREVLNQPQISLVHDLRLGSDLWLKNTFFFMSGDGFFDFNANYGDNNYFRLDPSIQIPSDIMMRAFVDNDQFGWIPQIEYNYGAGKLLAGGEVRIHRSLHWGRIESGTGLPEDVVGEKGNKHFYEYEGGKNVYSTFVSISHPFTEKLNVIAKLQAIYQQYLLNNEKFVGTDLKTSYFFVNPQVGVNYTISKSFSIYGSVSYTHREPPLKNLYEAESASWGVVPQFEKNGDGSYNFDRPFVKPEVLTNLELGTRIVLQKFIGSVNFYYMDFQNEIVPSGGLDVFGQPRVGNADKTLHYGIELEGAYKLPWNLQFNLNSNFSRNRYVDFKEYDDNGNPVKRNENYIANAPEIILNAGLSYLSDSFFAQVNVNHTGVQYTDNSTHPDGSKIDELTVDHFTVVNMGLGVNFGLQDARLRLSIEVNNLFDNKYLMNGFGWDNFFPSAGWNLMTNLKVEF